MANRFQRRVLLWANGMVKTGVTLGAPVRFSPAALLSLLVCTPAILDLLCPQAWAAQAPPTQARAGKEILLGQSAPLSGRSRQLGLDYRDGALAWFAEVNRRGGIHGRRIRLISLDDNYEPQLTVRNTKQLINQDRVFALFGYVGTPTVKAILPLAEQAHIPLVAPLTGATVLRRPFRPLVINLRASYAMEIEKIVNNLVRSGRQQIAVLHQNDAFGKDGLAGIQQAMGRRGLSPKAIATIQRNSTQAAAAARLIHAAKPSAVIIVAAYPSAAAFSLEMKKRGSTAQLMNVSFVGTQSLRDALPTETAIGIGISQVVPFPWNRRVPVVAEYQTLMQKQLGRANYGFTSLEGFLAAKLISTAIEQAGSPPSRQGLLSAFNRMQSLNLGGFQVSLTATDHQASDYVELTFLAPQRWEP